jgi:hypothetical protein
MRSEQQSFWPGKSNRESVVNGCEVASGLIFLVDWLNWSPEGWNVVGCGLALGGGVLREGCGGRPQGGAQRSGARERSAPRSSPTPRGKAARPTRGGTPKKLQGIIYGVCWCGPCRLFRAIRAGSFGSCRRRRRVGWRL